MLLIKKACTEFRFCGKKSCNKDNHCTTVTSQLDAFQWNYRLTISCTTWLHPDLGCYSQLRNEIYSSANNQVNNKDDVKRGWWFHLSVHSPQLFSTAILPSELNDT